MDDGRLMRAVKDSLVTLLEEQREEHGKEPFDRKTRC